MTTTTATATIDDRLSQRNEEWKSFYAEQIEDIKQDKSHWLEQSISTARSTLITIGRATVLSAAMCVMVFTLLFISYDGTNISMIQAQYFAKLTLMVSFISALAVCLSTNVGQFKSLKKERARRYADDMVRLREQIDLADERVVRELTKLGIYEHIEKVKS